MIQQTRIVLAKTPLLVRVFGLYLITTGLLVPSMLYARPTQVVYNPTYVPPPIVSTEARRVINGTPDRIIVERLNVDLPIKSGAYDADTGEWTLSDDAAFFATITDLPNDYQGNTFIYGHDRDAVFAPLEGIRAGDKVRIKTTNGHTFVYAYASDAIVTPDVTDVLYAEPKKPQLTLMTCDGLFSEVRRIMYFDLVEVVS